MRWQVSCWSEGPCASFTRYIELLNVALGLRLASISTLVTSFAVASQNFLGTNRAHKGMLLRQ